MKNTFLKEHFLGITIILAAILIFCLPAIQGKILNSHDYVSWRYMSNEVKVFSDQNGGPTYWSNSMFGGFPAYLTYSNESGNWLGEIQNSIAFTVSRPIFLLFMCALGAYILGCALGFSLWLRVLLALALALSSYNPILASAGHDGKLLAIGYSGGVLAGLFYILNKKYWLGGSVYLIFFSYLFISGHYQIIYYVMLLFAFAVVVILYNELKTKDYKGIFTKLAIVVGCSIIAIIPSLQSVLLTKEYGKYTMRGGGSELTITKKEKKKNGGLDRNYAFSWSQGVGETFSLIVPNVHGPMGQDKYVNGATAEAMNSLGVNPSQAEGFLNSLPDYWGPQPGISGPVYFGAILIMLFFFGLLTVKSYHKWWIVASTVFFILLSWGKNFEVFNNFIFDYLPGYNKFRTPSMALSLPSILIPLLGIWGLSDVIQGKISKEEAFKALKISGGIALLLALFGGVFSSFWQTYQSGNYKELMEQLAGAFGSEAKANELMSAMKADMASAVQADGIRSLVFLVIGLGLLWALLKDMIKPNIFAIILSIVVFVDLFAVDKRYLSDEQYMDKEDYEAQMFAPRPVDQQIMQDTDPYYRVQDFTVNSYNDAKPALFHKLVGGYHPAKMESYQDLIDVQLSKNNISVYNMLNTKYFIVPGQNKEPQVMPNPEACGNAWFINEIKMVKTADEEILALNGPSLSGDSTAVGNFNPKTTAIVRETFKDKISKTVFVKDSTASIKLTKYGINDLTFESNNSQDGFGVFSDMYYEGGWQCKIDGKITPIIKTNYVLRGLHIPRGKHTIQFNFEPANVSLGKTLSILGSLLILVLFGIGLGMNFKQNSKGSIH